MKKTTKLLSVLSILSTIPAHALFSNGGFENVSEGFTDWNLRYGQHSGNLDRQGKRGSEAIVWQQSGDQPAARIVVPTTDASSTNPDEFFDPFVDAFNRPYEGTHKALLNYHLDGSAPGGNFHATQISQTATVTDADKDINGNIVLYVSWGAVMNNPSHGSGEDPFFEISIKVNGVVPPQDDDGDGNPDAYELHYSNEPSLAWKLVKNSPSYDPIYFTHRVYEFTGLQVGDVVELTLTVGDCSQGAHGVNAWIDYAGSEKPPEVIDPTGECISARDQYRQADYSVVTGNVLSGGYGEMGANSVMEGTFQVKGNSFLRSFATITGDFTHESSESFQDGAVIEGTNGTGTVVAPVINSRILTPSTGWYEIRNGEVTTLTAGPYGDVVIRANATVTLDAGTYIFNSLDIEGGATVIVNNASAPISIQVAGNMDVRSNANLQIAESKNLEWYTHDNRLELHSNVNMAGAIIAPVGQVVLQPQGTLTGSISAVDILIEANSTVTCLESGIPSSSSSTSSSSSDPSSSSSTGSSSSQGGTFICEDDCLTAQPITWGANLNTTDAVWYVTDAPLNGWSVSEGEDRVITVNGVVAAPGTASLMPAADGKFYFHFGEGSKSWTSWSKW